MTRAAPALRVVGEIAVPGLLVGLVGLVLSLLYGLGVPVLVCLVTGLVLAAARLGLASLPIEDSADLAPASPRPVEQRSSLGDFAALQARLSAADRDRFESRLRPALRSLAGELLRQRHGLDWLGQPRQAREILGPQLWALLTAPGHTLDIDYASLERWILELEQL